MRYASKHMMFLAFTVLLFTMACNSNPDIYRAGQKLNDFEKQQFIYSIIRYAGPQPSAATEETKFDAEFDGEYWQTASRHRLDWYHEDAKSGKIYFGISRVAPSLHQKRVLLAGYLQRDAEGEITVYHEVFRTWRFTDDEMNAKAPRLIAGMINGKDLSPYYPENSGAEEFIEFPNATSWFDVDARRWFSSLEDPAEALRREIISSQTNQ